MATSENFLSDTLGAGQLAALVNGAYITGLSSRWGTPQHPAEPISAAVSGIQREISQLRICLWTVERYWSTGARRSAMRWERDYWDMWDYLLDLMPRDTRSAHSIAGNAEEYAALMSTPRRTGRIDYKELKARIRIEEYAGGLTTLKKGGTTVLKGKCPLPNHDDKTASFFVYPGNQSWYCFGCLKGGDVIDLAHAAKRDIR